MQLNVMARGSVSKLWERRFQINETVVICNRMRVFIARFVLIFFPITQ